MIRNIIFDIGRVLIGFEWDEYMESLFDDEATREAVTAATFGNGLWNELDRGIMKTQDIFDKFIEAAPEYEEEIKQAYGRVGECTTRKDYSIPWIEELKSRGYNVYYLSNYSEYVIGVSQHALDFLPYMDGGVFSYKALSTKPDSLIYETLFEKYNLKPEECIFIDDKPDNIEAGNAFGMPGIVFESYEQAKAWLDEALG